MRAARVTLLALPISFGAVFGPGPAEPATPEDPRALLGAGVRALRAGDHAEAVKSLRRIADRKLANPDYRDFFLGEALFYAGQPSLARVPFESVARDRRSRFAGPASFRAADCLWAEGRRPEAATRYEALVARATPGADQALVRSRIAEVMLDTDARKRDRAMAHLRVVALEHPSHPLAAEAAARLEKLAEGTAPAVADAKPTATSIALSVDALLRRAEVLSDGRNWSEALTELQRLPATLTERARARRDLLTGKTLFRSRKDYPRAAAILLGVVDALPADDAAWAAFHGARALSRADRDDEAIAGYLRVVERFPRSAWTAEAAFLAGFLDFNRGRFAAGVPRLREALARFGKTRFGADAAWYLALSHFFLGQADAALSALREFETRGHLRDNQRPDERVLYWRARFLSRLGRAEEARALQVQLAAQAPLEWYGLLAAARLREAGAPDGFALPDGGAPLAPLSARAAQDRDVRRVDELVGAGLADDAGIELERAADDILDRLGRPLGLAVVLDRARQSRTPAKAYRLAALLGEPALAVKPAGPARTVWEAAYPLAYAEIVDRYGPAEGNPEHLLTAIMRKESGFDPYVVSYADARGLLQMIPPTSRRVAEMQKLPFLDEDLFDVATNIRLGAAYIGSLHRKFKDQVPLTAGAYNAGPRAMMRWCDQHGEHPLDELVELVAYEQTREYIKRVTGVYARYRYLYAGERFVPRLQVDARYEAAGPNY
jgi:soluble lytic murein transglycosylase